MTKKGRKLSEEHKAKISAANRGINNPMYGKTGKKSLNFGKPCSEETKCKISKAQIGEKNHLYGKHHSEEAKKKISEAGKGRKHSDESKKKMGQSKITEKNPMWKGGRAKSGGYIRVLNPKHPFCHKEGYVLEHRLIVEAQIGRYLKPQEVVHHINGIPDDNRPENLMAFINNSAHQRFEQGKRIKPEEIIFDGSA